MSFRAVIGQVRGEERGVVSVPVEGGAERGEASETCLIMAIHTRLLIRW